MYSKARYYPSIEDFPALEEAEKCYASYSQYRAEDEELLLVEGKIIKEELIDYGF